MTVLILGSKGLLGSAVKRILGGVCPLREELDLENTSAIQKYFQDHNPTLVINCAALSNVDKSETEPFKALQVNSTLPFVLATECRKTNATLVHISTDYVFGNRTVDLSGWTEEERPQPLSNYGKIKLSGEDLALINPNTYVLRVSSLYGPDRSCHSEWIVQALKSGKKVNICEDMIGSPTYTEDLAQWIKDLIEIKPFYGIYHAVPTGHVSRYGFAEELINLLGGDSKVLNRIKTSQLNLPSHRPLKPILSNQKWIKQVNSLPTWQESLKRYVAKIEQKLEKVA